MNKISEKITSKITKRIISSIFVVGVLIVILFLAQNFLFQSTSINDDNPVVALKDENGNQITASKVLLDGEDLGAKSGQFELDELEIGSHTFVIIWNGARYEETIYYLGEDDNSIIIQLLNPVNTLVSVWEKNLNEPISDITVYVDGENKGTTNNDGECYVLLSPGDHTFKLSGDGVSLTKIRTVGLTNSFIEFEIEKSISITMYINDKLTYDPLKGVKIYLDGSLKGETSDNGILEINNIEYGIHQISCNYKDVIESSTINVNDENDYFSFSISAPRAVTLQFYDEETNNPIKEMDVYLDDVLCGKTTRDGQLYVDSVSPELHKISMDVPGHSGMIDEYITVNIEDTITMDIDVPNPEFQVSIDAYSYYDYFALEEKGYISVTLTNTGEVDSSGTAVLVLLYNSDDYSIVRASKILEFGSLVPLPKGGRSLTKEWAEITAFKFGPEEAIVVVILDNWGYTPENNEMFNEVKVSNSILTEFILSTGNYIANNPEEVIGTIAKIILIASGL